ncbi:hypothetical protein PR003_g495 [Phytophthora rubi]|uniref:Uncharacterized protein n=1 Tax=Phytophthora rubi TaxID=129364 RepID=A0A6A4G9D5_9STRA|nr:hypothetical protein PR003_g495 [Phytophthora rubi]
MSRLAVAVLLQTVILQATGDVFPATNYSVIAYYPGNTCDSTPLYGDYLIFTRTDLSNTTKGGRRLTQKDIKWTN